MNLKFLRLYKKIGGNNSFFFLPKTHLYFLLISSISCNRPVSIITFQLFIPSQNRNLREKFWKSNKTIFQVWKYAFQLKRRYLTSHKRTSINTDLYQFECFFTKMYLIIGCSNSSNIYRILGSTIYRTVWVASISKVKVKVWPTAILQV